MEEHVSQAANLSTDGLAFTDASIILRALVLGLLILVTVVGMYHARMKYVWFISISLFFVIDDLSARGNNFSRNCSIIWAVK